MLCSVAFRWLLNDNEYVPHQELALVRASVVQVSSKVIGVMSRIRLADVTAAFVQKMDERVSTRKDLGPRADANLQRSQALKLCAGGHLGSLLPSSAGLHQVCCACCACQGGKDGLWKQAAFRSGPKAQPRAGKRHWSMQNLTHGLLHIQMCPMGHNSLMLLCAARRHAFCDPQLWQ